MKYVGPLYGKIGRRTIPLKMSSTDVDRLKQDHDELRAIVERAFTHRIDSDWIDDARIMIAKIKEGAE